MSALRHPLLAPIIVIAWLAATAFVPDVRLGIAIVGIGGGAIVLALEAGFFRRMLTPSIKLVGIGLTAAVVMIVATYGLYPIVAHAIPGVALSTHELYANKLRIPHPNAMVLLVTGLIVIGEELLWRGVVQEAVQSVPVWGRRGGLLSVPVSAVIYGLSHILIGSTLLTIVAVICGLFWSTIRLRTHSLLPALIAHLIWDMTILTHPLVGH